MREEGQYVGQDPGGHGIATKRIVGTGPLWKEYAHPGDVYTSVSGPAGQDMSAIYELVERLNPMALGVEVFKMFTNPAPELIATATAIIQFMQFGLDSPITKDHVSYHWAEVEPGITYFEHAKRYLRQVADRVRSGL
jgi:hypothetical protein